MTLPGILACALLCNTFTNVLLAQAKIEHTAAILPAAVSDTLRQAVESKGYRVTLDDGWTADFWFVKQLKTVTRDAPGSLYPVLSDGQFVALVSFPQGMSDYRGQKIAPGIYTLRYQLLPQDGNHMGVAPNPDFLLAIPEAGDPRPEQTLPYRRLVALSAKSAGTNHPAVIALENAGEADTVGKTDHGTVVATVSIPSGATTSQKLGIVLKGTAAQ